MPLFKRVAQGRSIKIGDDITVKVHVVDGQTYEAELCIDAPLGLEISDPEWPTTSKRRKSDPIIMEFIDPATGAVVEQRNRPGVSGFSSRDFPASCWAFRIVGDAKGRIWFKPGTKVMAREDAIEEHDDNQNIVLAISQFAVSQVAISPDHKSFAPFRVGTDMLVEERR